jgi:hypothetical protein
MMFRLTAHTSVTFLVLRIIIGHQRRIKRGQHFCQLADDK